MKLNRFKYKEKSESGDRWEVDPLTFGNFNLVVGRNATGKTRLLKAIARAAGELSGEVQNPAATAHFVIGLAGKKKNTRAGETNDDQEWAFRMQFFPFAGKMNLKRTLPNRKLTRLGLPEAHKMGLDNLGASFEKDVLKQVNAAGYEVKKIALARGANGQLAMQVREAKRSANTPFRKLSQGQQRTLTLLTFLTLIEADGQPATVVIDDFAEGLDFEHAELLTRFLLQKTAGSSLQLIIASNDRYVMNSVPLEHWTILVENKNTTHVFNYANSKKKFDDFKFTGLNNFDFFSMDFARRQA